MHIIHSIPKLRQYILGVRRKGRPIAFVPTMGALHEGHISLVHLARKKVGRGGIVAVSIFVNPTQFNQKSDLKKYPRTLSKDSAMCRKAGVDFIFAPSAKTMYPENFSTWVNEESLSKPLCGAARPGHFRGVCTVVLKLFNLVQPDLAIFGQKDAQQAQVICRMVRDLDIPVKMIVAPIIREKDGLAMSSRNRRLDPKERNLSTKLYQTLKNTGAVFKKGTRTTSVLKKLARQQLLKVPGLKIDYVEIVDFDTLKPVSRASSGNLMALAVFMGKVRLIDNIRL